MSKRKKEDDPRWQWEQRLIDAYHDYRWQLFLDPIYAEFVRWKACEVTPEDLQEMMFRSAKDARSIYGILAFKRDMLVRAIQVDEEWFSSWVALNPPPPQTEEEQPG